MIRIMKIVKERAKITEILKELFNISANSERMFFFGLIFITLVHICSCLWVFAAKFDLTVPTWINQNGYEQDTSLQLYVTAIYFTVTTITTVGYGDISANNSAERLLCVFLMLLGVISFSLTTGHLSSTMSTHDASLATYREQLSVLNEIHSKYSIS
jgi:hypothetical protein